MTAAAPLALILIAAVAVAILSRPERHVMSQYDETTPPTGLPQSDLGPSLDRPHPLRDVAADVSKVVGTAGGILTALVGWGVLTAAQGDAVSGLLGLIPGLVAAGTTVWAAWRTAGSGEARVTPITDPRQWIVDEAGRRILAELVPSGRHQA